jgi:SanA protein
MFRRLLLLFALGLVALIGGRAIVWVAASGTANAASTGNPAPLASGHHRVAIVFGAGLYGGRPGPLLVDRVRAGERLVATHRADLLLMSGDNSRPGYDEPGAMRRLALSDGVPASKIAVDYGGRRTWDSCERARTVFRVQHAIVVTNDFHRARAVVTCKAAGITVDGAVGTSTAHYSHADRGSWETRELLASWRAVVDDWVHHPPVPVHGSPIDIYNPCAVWNSLSAADRSHRPTGCRATGSRATPTPPPASSWLRPAGERTAPPPVKATTPVPTHAAST